jgi:hypothetical protein
MKSKPIVATIASLLLLATTHTFADDFADIRKEIAKRHDEAVKRLQDWIALPSIAAENRNYPAGAEHMAQLARDAGFQQRRGSSTSRASAKPSSAAAR